MKRERLELPVEVRVSLISEIGDNDLTILISILLHWHRKSTKVEYIHQLMMYKLD